MAIAFHPLRYIPTAVVNLPPGYFHKNSIIAPPVILLTRAISFTQFQAPKKGQSVLLLFVLFAAFSRRWFLLLSDCAPLHQ